MALINYFTTGQATPTQVASTQPQPTLQPAADVVMGGLSSVLSSGSDYIQNARQRGLELAATRGGINSSIAAGASERAAIEAAQPLAAQITGIQQNRENVQLQDWMENQNFGRTLYSQKFNSSLDMINSLNQMGIIDPELYTPEVLSGLGNFFTKNMNDLLKGYLRG